MPPAVPTSYDVVLPLKDYAAARGKSTRTVQRWLEAGELPGARMVEGQWLIPATADRAAPTSYDVVATSPAPVPVSYDVGSPLGHLVTLEDAAADLGTTVGGVRRLGDAGLMTIGPFGPNGGLRVFVRR